MSLACGAPACGISLQQSVRCFPQTFIVRRGTIRGHRRWEGAQCVVGSWVGALQQGLPTTLEIGDVGNRLPQSPVLFDVVLQLLADKLLRTDGPNYRDS